MTPITRRIVQAILYEVGAIVLSGPTLFWAFDEPLGSSMTLAALISAIALAWNYVFNGLFERWEARHPGAGRSLARRLAHGAGFEIGLAMMLVPLMAWWLATPLWQALVAELGFMLLFFVYAVVFTWAFDRVFGLPESVRSV